MSSEIRTGEILFVKCVKDGIPNRDPLRDSDARRIFPEDDGRISLSDVSIKRDVRDYVMARFPDGGPGKDRFVFVRKEFDEKSGKLLGRDNLARTLLERAGRVDAGNKREALMESAWDMRVFGAVFSVEKKSFNQVGPVQFGWAHSMHPVETRYVQGTVVMPANDAKPASEGQAATEGATQGTIWTTYTLPFAVFIMPGVINGAIARDTGMEADDLDLLLEALWFGTLHRQARGRGLQKPLFLLHVEYTNPMFRIGYLEEKVHIVPEDRETWLGANAPSAVKDVALDLADLARTLESNRDRIARIRLARAPELRLQGDLPEATGFDWMK